MKHRLLVLAASLSLLLPAASLAQPNPNGRPSDNRPGRPGDNGGSNRPGGPGDRPGRPGDNNGPNRPGRPDFGRPNPGGPGFGARPPQRPPQFSWRGRSFSQMRGPMFRYPPGYAYRRWAIGAFLPGIFLGTTYYYDDWRGLGIDRPPPGRRWVRYGSDLLLVNQRTRRVEDVIYDVFY
ncbi:MAG: RcnB family protein [Pseudomonadota bacterium]